jgi:bifunctional enzyme CysN/CysC
VVSMPSGKKSKVAQILTAGSPVEEAFAPQAVVITLEDEIDASRGDCFVKPGNAPMMENAVEAMLVWMSEEPLKPGKNLILKHTSLSVPATLSELRYKMDINSLRSEPASSLALNEIGRVRLECVRSLACDAYEKNRHTGAFILIDRLSNATLGAGMILDRTPAEEALERRRRAHDAGKNLRERRSQISTEARASALGQKPGVIWLTGLPRSGKSSIAYALEAELFARGTRCMVLDGESLRRGLCSDLGFAPADRDEHVRRSSELARLFADQGWVVIAALVSASAQQRRMARETVGSERFVEVHCDAPLEVCEARDAEGLYARARAGELAHVTGIDHAYEAPVQPELRLDTARAGLDENVQYLLAELQRRGIGRSR